MWKFNWLSFTCAINDHKLIVIIVKSVNLHIHFILRRKSFLPAYAQLGMLGTIFAMVTVVTLTATVTEQIKCYIHQLHSDWCIQKSFQRTPICKHISQHMFKPPHTIDDKIKVLLLLCIAKPQVKREYILSLWQTLYIDNWKFYVKTVSLGLQFSRLGLST